MAITFQSSNSSENGVLSVELYTRAVRTGRGIRKKKKNYGPPLRGGAAVCCNGNFALYRSGRQRTCIAGIMVGWWRGGAVARGGG